MVNGVRVLIINISLFFTAFSILYFWEIRLTFTGIASFEMRHFGTINSKRAHPPGHLSFDFKV